MSLPTNTWISVDRAYEIPRDKRFRSIINLSVYVDITNMKERRVNACYNFNAKKFVSSPFTPTHFMIIELPK